SPISTPSHSPLPRTPTSSTPVHSKQSASSVLNNPYIIVDKPSQVISLASSSATTTGMSPAPLLVLMATLQLPANNLANLANLPPGTKLYLTTNSKNPSGKGKLLLIPQGAILRASGARYVPGWSAITGIREAREFQFGSAFRISSSSFHPAGHPGDGWTEGGHLGSGGESNLAADGGKLATQPHSLLVSTNQAAVISAAKNTSAAGGGGGGGLSKAAVASLVKGTATMTKSATSSAGAVVTLAKGVTNMPVLSMSKGARVGAVVGVPKSSGTSLVCASSIVSGVAAGGGKTSAALSG
ncbi:hypothetical protein GOODEAATRI_020157, partial [Goodea atripinnis]